MLPPPPEFDGLADAPRPLCRRTALLFACRPLRRILHKDKAGGFLSGLLSPSVVRAPLLAALRRLGRRILAVLAAVKSGVCAALPAAAFALAALAVQTVAFAPEALANTLCTGKGWTGGQIAGDFVCSIKTVDKSSSGLPPPGGCWMGGTEGRICSNVFGSNANIPQRPSDGSEPTYVFNCDPDDETGLIPATINTIGATSCACPAGQGILANGSCGACTGGQEVQDGVCACPTAGYELQDGTCAPTANTLCTGKGWTGGQLSGDFVCNIKTDDKSSSDPPAAGCWMGGTEGRICSNVFGSNANIPQRPSDGSEPTYVFNCDPDDETGLIPATINTIGATSCACPAGQGILADGSCGACPTGQIIQDGICTSCPAGQLIKSGVCAAPTTPEEKCTAAKWSYNFGEDACYINFKISGGSNQMACKFDDAPAFLNYIPCEDVFGADYSLPFKPSGSNPVYVYNCDPDDESGLIPATVNTIGATECTCPAGHVINNGVCVCPSGQGLLDNGSCGTCPPGQEVIDNVCIAPTVLMDLCEGAGWGFSTSENSCGVLLTLSGGAASDKCYLFGSTSPQCADVFASTVHYFPSPTLAADGATLRFVYNCDPDGESGLIPAMANTIAATECGCESGASLFNDVCIREEGDLGLADELLCGAFGGTVQTATGGKEVCSGMDANDTFCIMDSAAGFPCRGLFKHLRSCNLEFNRKALNPFFCGENCGVQKAVGSECR